MEKSAPARTNATMLARKATVNVIAVSWKAGTSPLNEVSSALQSVNDGSRRQGLLDEVNQLNTKVERHDPKASKPATICPTARGDRGIRLG